MSDREIIELRKSGLTCEQTAERLGITENDVWQCMRRNGLAGKIRNVSGARKKPQAKREARPRRVWGGEAGRALMDALKLFDVVTVERGASGGFIATVDDETTGTERGTIAQAIESAVDSFQG